MALHSGTVHVVYQSLTAIPKVNSTLVMIINMIRYSYFKVRTDYNLTFRSKKSSVKSMQFRKGYIHRARHRAVTLCFNINI